MPEAFRYISTSLMHFTRIPGIRNAPHDTKAQREALKYFPLVGWLVGAVGAGVLYLGQTWVSPLVGVVLAITAMVCLTGAMHEDGLADSVDAFGGGFDSARVLEIMKDSRLGSFGVIALILLFAFKFTLLLELTSFDLNGALLSLMFAQAASRFAVLLIPASLDYVQAASESKSRSMVGERLSVASLAYSGSFVVIPLLFLQSLSCWIGFGIALLASYGLSRYFRARIGGFSGDCLGATQQISEILIYFTILVSWNYI